MPKYIYAVVLGGFLIILAYQMKGPNSLEEGVEQGIESRLGGAPASDSFPTNGWPESTPAEQGMDEQVLQALDEEIAAGKHGYVDGMLVIRDGHVVYERAYPHDYETLFAAQPNQVRGAYNYYDPEWHPYYKGTDLHTMQSVSKSVMATLIGIAIGRGEIEGTNVPAAGFFADYQAGDDDPRRASMTLEHLLTMTAGIEWDEDSYDYTDPRNSCAVMESLDDWAAYVWGLPMAAEPGSTYVYSSGVTMLINQVLRHATGEHALSYATKYLFGPLGIKDFYWKQTPAGETDAEGGLYLTPRDLAKIGYLYAMDGIWEGKRLLPEGWVERATSPLSDPAYRDWRYGYQWWLMPYGEEQRRYSWQGNGYGGQHLVVIPEHDLVAVFTGWNIWDQQSLDEEFAVSALLNALR
jgi:CubicO group peptidase (beta-lactamase class C family)